MSEKISFPFAHQLSERKRMFCELYSSLIVHRELSSYITMLEKIGDPAQLLQSGQISLHTINSCVQAIESSYNHRGIKFLITNVIDAILDSFRDETFEFFKSGVPAQRELIEMHSFSAKEIRLIENMLRAKLEGHKQVCNDLDQIYERIHQSFCQIYFDATTPAKPAQSIAKGVGVVGPVVFSWGGSPVGDALADTVVDKRKQQLLINQCMTHVLEYLHRVSAFHRYMMTSFYDMYQLFSDISDRYNQLEMSLYSLLSPMVQDIDGLFSKYYQGELALMGDTYRQPLSAEGGLTFNDVVQNVHDHLQLYIRAQDAA